MAKEAIELKKPIILDEVQKVPQLLDEVHWLMENKGLRFVLCGSSARKLKKGTPIYWAAGHGGMSYSPW